jgi:hypothetical protein
VPSPSISKERAIHQTLNPVEPIDLKDAPRPRIARSRELGLGPLAETLLPAPMPTEKRLPCLTPTESRTKRALFLLIALVIAAG